MRPEEQCAVCHLPADHYGVDDMTVMMLHAGFLAAIDQEELEKELEAARKSEALAWAALADIQHSSCENACMRERERVASIRRQEREQQQDSGKIQTRQELIKHRRRWSIP